MRFRMMILALFVSVLTLITDCCYGCHFEVKHEDTNSTLYINCTLLKLAAVCDDDGLCWALVGIGGVIAAVFLIAMITCIIFTCIVAKGIKFLIQYFSTSASLRANREHDDIERDQTQQQQQQNEVSGGEQTTGRYTPEPQCDSIENEQAPVHYFELEPPPQHINTKAKQQRKPISNSHGAMAMSKLHSLPELATPKELPGEEYNPPNAPGYPTEQRQKVSAVSLPPSITQYSSIHTKEITEQEKAKEAIPIYSIPDKSKKSTKTILEPMEYEERETEELPCSHPLDSFFNIKPQIMVEEGGGKSTRLGSSSPPPPLLPPKPGQKNKPTEDAGENEESVYTEASSKPLQVDSQRKTTDEWSDTAKCKTATVMGNISPFHLHARYFQKEQGHVHKRSLSAVDRMKRKEAHSRLPANLEHDQLYGTALSLLESKEEEEKLRVGLLKNEEET